MTVSRLQTNNNLNILRKSGRKYKKEINKAFKTYKQKVINKIRVLKTTNPREYWNLINDRKSQKTFNDISLKVLHDHFKKINQAEINETEINITVVNVNPLFNDHVTTDEMLKLVRTLKNNKSSGHDQVLNEFLKYSPPKIIDMIVRLFNVILDIGIFPEQWSVGIIKPLYKNTGARDNPNNYRGITFLSCLGKLFSFFLNSRLTRFVEVNQIIGSEQAGFRSGFSTTDHMFALKSLIDIYLSKRKRLYCCYIDYSKAFDTISRSELWSKLLKCNVSGKIFRVVYNMYKSAKSCVAINGLLTDNFSCLIGVRQGENLSPFYFHYI